MIELLSATPRFARVLRAAIAVLTLGLSLALAGCDSKPEFRNTDVTGADFASGFALTGHDGKPRTLADFRGKAVLVFFGYTQCPDVCPTTLAELAEVKQTLGADGDRLQVLFVSVDPERDTPEVLKAYMAAFDPGFLALYAASPDQLAALAKDFKVYYKRVDGKTPTSYTMDHTAASYVYDPQGRLRLYARYGIGPQAMADDIRLLLKGQ